MEAKEVLRGANVRWDIYFKCFLTKRAPNQVSPLCVCACSARELVAEAKEVRRRARGCRSGHEEVQGECTWLACAFEGHML